MFQEDLQKIVDGVEGGIAGLIMGFDWIPLEAYARAESPADINTVGMELSVVLNQVRKTVDILDLGLLHELCIKAEQLTLVIRCLSENYFLALALTPDGDFGKGRYLMRLAAPKLQAEL